MESNNLLPTPSPAFTKRKSTILEHLAVPDEEYTDASPKGSVDVGIRGLIARINGVGGLVTTSSCAGRVSVFLEGEKSGRRKVTSGQEREDGDEDDDERILHILTASPHHAQLVIQAGMEAGFRESGAVSLLGRPAGETATPMVAVRSMGLSLESLVGFEDDEGRKQSLVSPGYLDMLVRIANERFVENGKRIARFEAALTAAFAPKKPVGWEDAETRRERKRLDGLRRRAEMKKAEAEASEEEENVNVDVIFQEPDVL
ncbi:hypothetical protein QBC47DRAFT_411185 [Echria macrotheca]|uniref:tRNA(Phe) 7-[(3-amino-3-carboxypropyl)-4-demethylwyosine(37)-N(4)]-methyltransferase n=1 Tax=Echria macrotheca TaxID=438768 RepID=A0AAJ0BIB1_9PEZI|nr:hypothetical protein QBC47DRAFT_411185 [Echria macrotheca]